MASAYVVRIKSNNELVGIFVAERIEELAFLADQVADNGYCEYARLPSGGMCAHNVAPNVPNPKPDDEDDGDWFKCVAESLSLDEYWGNAMHNEKLHWKDLLDNATPAPAAGPQRKASWFRP